VDRLSEVDDGAVALVVIVVADLARVPTLEDAGGTDLWSVGLPLIVRFFVVPVAVPVGSSRRVENGRAQAKNVPAGTI